MTHLTMEQLLALREPGHEPGTADALAHLAACGACAEELRRLEQRVARLRALPILTPARDQWPAVRARVAAERRRRGWQRAGAAVATLALAASLALVVWAGRGRDARGEGAAIDARQELDAARVASRELERTLEAYRPDARVLDGRTARIASELEDRIAVLDDALEAAELQRDAEREARLLNLWRERVGLMDALVDVHVTRASNVGL